MPRLLATRPQWPMWDVAVYWWGGRQALRGATLYAAHEPRSFTYPPFAAAIFGPTGAAPEIVLKVSMVVLSLAGLALLAWLSVRAAGFGRRPELAFAAGTLALLTQPVAYTLHLGEVNLVLAGLIAADLLRRHDGAWWQGIATGVAAGIKLTPLIFMAYLLATRRIRAAVAAIVTFGGTVIAGFVLLPGPSRSFWLRGVFLDQGRIGNNYNPANQSLAGMMARLGGGLAAVHFWWVLAALVTGAGGVAIATVWHRRGQQLAGLACCGLTGTLVSPISWTHHWVWVIPLLVAMAASAWRRRSPSWAVAALALFAAFSGLDPMPWPGRRPGLLRTVEGNLYVLCGLAVLVAAALLAARRWQLRGGDGSSYRMTPGLQIWIERMTRSRVPSP
ncbi:MAG TPA: glycosyltransferase 87 family protein [Streptosporangiaceae bacterium]|nr:glycosyltransferase 87 family protein [Streptosporangiaceae bacterium]